MLEHVLKAIAAGGALRLEDLAHQLDVPLALVEAMIDKLEQLGYLSVVETSCTQACHGCASRGICAIMGGGKVWSLSEKGARAAARLGPA